MKEKKDWNKNNIFKKEYIKKMQEYFDIDASFFEKIETSTKKEIKEYANSLPTLQGFLALIKVDRDTFFEWLKQAQDESYNLADKEYKTEFLNTYKKCIEISESIWINNSLKGLYPSNFATFVGKNIFGWKDKSELLERLNTETLSKNKQAYEKIEKRVEDMSINEIDKVILEVLG